MASDLSSSEYDPRSSQNSGKREQLLKEEESPAKNDIPILHEEVPQKIRKQF